MAHKVKKRVAKKVYFRWFDAYFTRLEITYKPYTGMLKRKVMKNLLLERRRNWIKAGQANTKYKTNLMYKTWFALLENLNANKEDKQIANDARESYRKKTYTDKPVIVNAIIDKILPDELNQQNEHDGNIYLMDQRSSIQDSISEINVGSYDARVGTNSNNLFRT